MAWAGVDVAGVGDGAYDVKTGATVVALEYVYGAAEGDKDVDLGETVTAATDVFFGTTGADGVEKLVHD